MGSVVAAAVFMVGCARSSDPQKEITPDVSVVLTGGPVSDATKAFGAPLAGQSIVDFYLNGDGSLRWARELFIHASISECMSVQGFQFPPIGFTRADIQAESRSSRFHIPLSSEQADSYGYSDPTVSSNEPADTQNGSTPANDSDAYVEAEYNCGRDAIARAYNDREVYESLNSQLVSLRESFFDVFWSSQPVLDLNSEWSECMMSIGIEAADPASLRTATLARAPETQVGIATSDAQCRDELEYDTRLLSMFQSADAAFAMENSELLSELRSAGEIPELSDG